MPYNEQDFLNGLAAGLTATACASMYDNAPLLVRFQIHLEDARKVYIPFGRVNGDYAVIDWGDGTIEQKGFENRVVDNYGYSKPVGYCRLVRVYGTPHEYKASGDYVIKIRLNRSIGNYTISSGTQQITSALWGSCRYTESAEVCAISPTENAQNASFGILDASILRSAHFKGNIRLSVGANVFRDCSKLAFITFDVRNITLGYNCFNNCPALKDIYYSGTEEQWSAINAYPHPVKDYITVHCNSTGPNDAHDG